MRAVKRPAVLQHLGQRLRSGVATHHGRLVMAGLLVGVAFSPFWIYDIILGTLNGAASLLMVSAFGLGLYQLWTRRERLARLKASSEDRWLGHLIILMGLGVTPFCASAEWSQKLVWMFILVGIAISTWGLPFFARFPAPVFLIGVGLFPQPTLVGKTVWETFTPPQMLERFMAWAGSIGLRLIGQGAEVDGAYVTLAENTVFVDWGCSGYDLACIAAVASLLMGLYFNQSFFRTVMLIMVGIALAMVANVPRIMLMTMADAYWGPESFEFWHGFWGGQIFLTILFTAHYYVVMALLRQESKKQVP